MSVLNQPYVLILGASMATNVTTNPIEITGVSAIGISAVYTGTPSGTIKLQAAVVGDGSDWNDVANSSFTITTAGTSTWNYDPVAVPYLRVVYTATSSTGALTVNVFKKGV